MNEPSNEMQPLYGGHQVLEMQQPDPADQQEAGTDPYQQHTPPYSYRPFGYQPYTPNPQQYGYQQPYGAPYPGNVSPFERTSLGMRARTAGTLCYLLGWVSGLIFLLLERENRFVRFHAMQSLLFFGILNALEWVFSYLPFFGPIGGALGLIVFIRWIVLMVKAHQGQYYKLPLLGDLAEQLINQIRV
jgi:uncharacterized membrane protein